MSHAYREGEASGQRDKQVQKQGQALAWVVPG